MITLKTLPQATAQQVFDQVARHLLTQYERSADDKTCQYRGPRGLKCAAGCLIGDDEYDSSFESCIWRTLVNTDKAPSTHVDLIRNLQTIHDEIPITYWQLFLKDLALDQDLSADVLKEFA